MRFASFRLLPKGKAYGEGRKACQSRLPSFGRLFAERGLQFPCCLDCLLHLAVAPFAKHFVAFERREYVRAAIDPCGYPKEYLGADGTIVRELPDRLGTNGSLVRDAPLKACAQASSVFSSRRMILPVLVFGTSSTNCTWRGTL